jgi:uncharacterized protein with HEPN domain
MAKAGRSRRDGFIHLIHWFDVVERQRLGFEGMVEADRETRELALTRALEVVGEICGQSISEHPLWAKPWRAVILDHAYRLRNRIAHGYDSLDPKLLLVIATAEIPRLKALAVQWLAECDDT